MVKLEASHTRKCSSRLRAQLEERDQMHPLVGRAAEFPQQGMS